MLARIARAELLSVSSRARLLGPHKTGPWADFDDVFVSMSDVGIVSMPEGRRLALALMVANAQAEESALEASIPAAVRAVLEDWRRCP